MFYWIWTQLLTQFQSHRVWQIFKFWVLLTVLVNRKLVHNSLTQMRSNRYWLKKTWNCKGFYREYPGGYVIRSARTLSYPEFQCLVAAFLCLLSCLSSALCKFTKIVIFETRWREAYFENLRGYVIRFDGERYWLKKTRNCKEFYREYPGGYVMRSARILSWSWISVFGGGFSLFSIVRLSSTFCKLTKIVILEIRWREVFSENQWWCWSTDSHRSGIHSVTNHSFKSH